MLQGGDPVKYPLHLNKGCLRQRAGNGIIGCEDNCVTRLNSFITKGIVKDDVVIEGVQVAATFSSDRRVILGIPIDGGGVVVFTVPVEGSLFLRHESRAPHMCVSVTRNATNMIAFA